MSYSTNEHQYRKLVATYLGSEITPEVFRERYFKQWKSDRDAQWESCNQVQSLAIEEQLLCGILDNIFVACDCYSSDPDVLGAISADELFAEIQKIAESHWRGIGTQLFVQADR